jgi:signal transduction histidine kinase
VIGFSEALEESYFGDLNEKQTRYVKFIQEGGRHLLALINDILDLSKVEAGKMDMEWGPVQVRDLLENSLIMVKEKCLTHRIALTLNVASDISDRVITADARKLKQIVFNLLSNSAKFTPDGGSITVGAQLVDGTLPRDTIEVSVVDTGVGVPSELVETVFDPFYQVKGGSRDKSSGTGLGLSLTRRLVELHDGKIWMTSPSTPLRAGEASQNPGCRVTFRLPVEAKQAITGTSEPRQAPMKRFSIATCPEDGTTAGELLRNARKRQE